jgi:hypothetical protein
VTGTLRHHDDAPAFGQWIWFTRKLEPVIDKDNARVHTELKRYAISDAEGKYQIFLTPGDYEVTANQDIRGDFGKKPEVTNITVTPDDEITSDFTISDKLFIRLLHADGTPVYPGGKVANSNFSIRYYTNKPVPGGRTRFGVGFGIWTIEDGTFEVFPAQADETTYLYMTDDGKEGITYLLPHDRKNLEIVDVPLTPTAQVRFRLLDEQTGQPIVGRTLKSPAAVHLPNEMGPYRPFGDSSTDANGEVTVNVPAFGDYVGLKYHLNIDVADETTTNAVKYQQTERTDITFAPKTPGEVIDLGDVRVLAQ